MIKPLLKRNGRIKLFDLFRFMQIPLIFPVRLVAINDQGGFRDNSDYMFDVTDKEVDGNYADYVLSFASKRIYGRYDRKLSCGFLYLKVNNEKLIFADLKFSDQYNGPTIVDFSVSQNLIVRYIKNGVYLHRVNGPAFLQYKKDILVYEAYRIKNMLHNRAGPAVRNFNAYSGMWRNSFYINNINISLERFVKNVEQ